MRNWNHRINESYFKNTSSDEIADDVIATSTEASTAAEESRVFGNNDKDNCIILSYEIKGIKDMRALIENIDKWSKCVFYAVNSLDLFDNDESFFIMIRSTYPNDHLPLYYNYGINPKFGNREIFTRNLKSSKAAEVFDSLVNEYAGKRDTNKIISFDLLIGYDDVERTIRSEYNFWKRVNKFRTYIHKYLSKIVKNRVKHWINVGFAQKDDNPGSHKLNKKNKKYFSVGTTNNLESISPAGYESLLTSKNNGLYSDEEWKTINSLINGMKEDIGAEIPDGILAMMKPKNIEWLKNSGLKVHKNGDVLECTFSPKVRVNIFHIEHVWFYCVRKRYIDDVDCSSVIINIPNILDINTDLQQRRFGPAWWTKDCKVNVEKLVINGLKPYDLQTLLTNMDVKTADITRIGGLSNADRRSFNMNYKNWMNPQTELTSMNDEIVYDNNRIILNKK